MGKAYDLLEKITDETSFIRFLRALREECVAGENQRDRGPEDEILWESFQTKDFLRSAEDWASSGDFGQGQHYGEPMLRRVAAMLLSGKYKYREPKSPDDYE